MVTATPSADVLRHGYRGWCFSEHAQERARQMGVGFDEIADVMNDPELDYPSIAYPGGRTRVGGRLALGYSGRTVMTVLWRGKESRE